MGIEQVNDQLTEGGDVYVGHEVPWTLFWYEDDGNHRHGLTGHRRAPQQTGHRARGGIPMNIRRPRDSAG